MSTSGKKLLGTKGIATSSQDATSNKGITTSNKKLPVARRYFVFMSSFFVLGRQLLTHLIDGFNPRCGVSLPNIWRTCWRMCSILCAQFQSRIRPQRVRLGNNTIQYHGEKFLLQKLAECQESRGNQHVRCFRLSSFSLSFSTTSRQPAKHQRTHALLQRACQSLRHT